MGLYIIFQHNHSGISQICSLQVKMNSRQYQKVIRMFTKNISKSSAYLAALPAFCSEFEKENELPNLLMNPEVQPSLGNFLNRHRLLSLLFIVSTFPRQLPIPTNRFEY